MYNLRPKVCISEISEVLSEIYYAIKIGVRTNEYLLCIVHSIAVQNIFRTFITTPILCHVLLMHDCMLAIVGGLSTVAADVTIVSLMYFDVLKESFEHIISIKYCNLE